MKPINQTIVDKNKGNCMQAAFASLFEADLCNTVNVLDYPEDSWHIPFLDWLETSTDYEYQGVINAHPKKELTHEALQSLYAVKGFFYGVVPSRNFEGVTHAVIIDRHGVVVHDPDPSKKWLGVNTIETGSLVYFYLFEPKNGFVYPE